MLLPLQPMVALTGAWRVWRARPTDADALIHSRARPTGPVEAVLALRPDVRVPRWSVDQATVFQYLYPAGALALLAGCWAVRRRTRAPLAALLAFAGMLFPVLGFLDVYPFRFSFVADHFQYLASTAIIALVSAGAATVLDRARSNRTWLAICAILLVAGTLGTLTWNQSHEYTDAPTLYRAVLRRKPSSWLAHANLGALLRTSAPDQALGHLTEAVRLKPDLPEAHYTLANLLQQTGRMDDAIREYHETIRLSPGMALAYYNLGNTVLQMGRLKRRAARSAMRFTGIRTSRE